MTEKLSEKLRSILDDANAIDAMNAKHIAAIVDAHSLAKRVEDAPFGEIVNSRANSFGGYNVEIRHDVSFVVGNRVRLVLEGE